MTKPTYIEVITASTLKAGVLGVTQLYQPITGCYSSEGASWYGVLVWRSAMRLQDIVA